MKNKEFGKYTLLDHMGKGGVASVYRATDNKAGNIVAIKIFSPDEKRTIDRTRKFRDREVRMLISVQHPNVVKYYEAGELDDDCFYTMEFVENSLLKRMQRPGEFSIADKIHMLRQCANALQAIHNQGIVHRDIKPGNILLDQSPTGALHVKVTDLGIAKHVSETDIVREEASKRVPGTPKYLSPEQIKLKPVDGRADVFGLGVLAYELLTGKEPFKAANTDEYLKANLRQNPRPVHHVNSEIPEWLSPLVDKMLAKDRENRYDSDTLSRDLELTYQHMVSNAPLVEQSNPESVFYVPPAPKPGEERALPKKKLPVKQACIAATVIIGAVLTFLLWPEKPGPLPEPGAFPATPELSDSEMLKAATDLARTGRRWKALGLLRSVDSFSLSEGERQDWISVCERVHGSLAEPCYEQGVALLAEGKVTEAEVVLQRMQEFFPMAEKIAPLSEAIKKRKGELKVQQEWYSWVRALRRMLAKKQFEEVISECEKLLLNVGDDEEKKAALRVLIVDSMNAWAEAMLRSRADAKAIQHHWDMAKQYREQPWAKDKIKDHDCDLTLLMGRYYQSIRYFEKALEWYRKAEKCGGTTAEQARARIEEMVREQVGDPVDIAPTAKDIRDNGFASKVWWQDVPEGGEQKVTNGALLMVQKSDGPERENTCQTIRPVRSVQGFHTGVKFRMKLENADKIEECGAGIWVGDRIKNQAALFFDGHDYKVFRKYMRGGRELAGTVPVKPGVGDEVQNWHELSVKYEFDLEKLYLYLDGEEVASYDLELGAVAVRVFVRVKGEGECRVLFKDVYCDKP